MIYLSKGLLLRKASESSVSVSHCGALHKLTDAQAALWLAGQYYPGYTETPEQDLVLEPLSGSGIIECNYDTDNTALYRLLTNCVICPVRAKRRLALLTRTERTMWRWVRFAGLRPTMAEMTLLTERGVKPVPALLGEANRQALTEEIYTSQTIYDGILESLMEKSPARDRTVQTVLGLLRKKKIYLV